MNWIAVALGGALGACCRYGLALHFSAQTSKFPIATFVANAIGCFLMGLCFVWIAERAILSDTWRHFLMIGGLGALTTYSTFAVDAIALFHNQDYVLAFVYVFATFVTCFLGLAIGMFLARLF